MIENNSDTKPVLLLGDGSLAESIALCLLKANEVVHFCTSDVRKAKTTLLEQLAEMKKRNKAVSLERLKFLSSLASVNNYRLAVVITEEDVSKKQQVITDLARCLPADAIIAINTESISLEAIQQSCLHPERIIGLNWTEPAHTTRFLEIIRNNQTAETVLDKIKVLAKTWKKDAYVVENFGVRSRMLSAMVREAFYLVENGYASVEDIDRACRNDAGYYLPFAGNCRYMDLMGTYAYGMVMKDLNPDLSREKRLPQFFVDILSEGGNGMENGKGLYNYTPEEKAQWQETFREFSFRIEEIIDKYPFNYQHNGTHA
ncbi:3-hydroxyacyl-CoA dehydrogenase family protein [Flavisolibacter ginsenosidimutans]|uniref:3-hydroxyacyl-CoA dehydrogenase family protein n=1 Tax=Flavisolibacter ginsenosidimutans TaxID=661481 RepID=A0A5B8UE54_9BACT|nr:3-hydroxyacyl-CoA dehydrogenase family protein [Flavisolibacter ginsenosidimutans]QEC54409.1 3-hydroxyacyl-CoA dehydrogenase family protein [Flavisolibacter ginsenosidimutans]